MQEDECRSAGLNLYTYCRNNPVVYYNPSGYLEIPLSVLRDCNRNEAVTTDGGKGKYPIGEELAEMARNSKPGIDGYPDGRLPEGIIRDAGMIFVGENYTMNFETTSLGNQKWFYYSEDGKLRFRMMNKAKKRGFEGNFEVFARDVRVVECQTALSNYHVIINKN